MYVGKHPAVSQVIYVYCRQHVGPVQARAPQWTYTLVHAELFFMELMNSAAMFIAVGHIIAAIYDYQ